MPGLGRAGGAGLGDLGEGSWFDSVGKFASDLVLPFTALGIALLVGWAWTPRRAASELLASGEEPKLPRWFLAFGHYAQADWAQGRKGFPMMLLVLWGVLIRWVAPIAIVLVFLNSTGVLDFTKGESAPPAQEASP